jgi:superfamily II DNA or RNA helicase
MVGRGLRTAAGKDDCLILDHSGCVHRHGFAHDAREWTLDGERALVERDKSGRDETEPKSLTCPECYAVFCGMRVCPECGYCFAPKGAPVVTLEGELVEVGAPAVQEQRDQRAFFAELRGFAAESNYKPGWAAYKFKEKFGSWPPRSWNDEPLVEPSISTRRWLKSRDIRRWKSPNRVKAA